jgi:hypothetical protein
MTKAKNSQIKQEVKGKIKNNLSLCCSACKNLLPPFGAADEGTVFLCCKTSRTRLFLLILQQHFCFMRFNWKLLLLHLAACSLVVLSFRQLFFLLNPSLIRLYEVYENPLAALGQLHRARFSIGPVWQFLLWNALASWLGLALALLLSLIALRRQKAGWWHSIAAIICCIILLQLGVYTGGWLKTAAYWPGRLLQPQGLLITFIINGAWLMGLALFLFFSKRIKTDLHPEREPANLSSI